MPCFLLFNVTAPTEIYTYRHTLSLHDALPIEAHPRSCADLRGPSYRSAPGVQPPQQAPAFHKFPESGPFSIQNGGGSLKHWLARQLRRSGGARRRSEEHTSELQSLMRISYAVFCLTKKNNTEIDTKTTA